MGLKLYYGGCFDFKAFAVANSEEQAIARIGEKINAPFLPIAVEEIAEVDGYFIRATTKWEALCADQRPDEAKEAGENENNTEVDLRHCKKCDFACETQGELLKHYREMHPKGD